MLKDMRKLLIAIVLLFSLQIQAQTVSSSEKFLGYKVGTKFTPHYRIVDYFRQMATTHPDRIKLEQYGETYEGRPLVLAFVSSPEHIGKLEQVRLNNLRLAQLSNDKTAPSEKAPAIVWLSYNVHGNEPSSSEAAMLTLDALIAQKEAGVKEWLANTIVVIDPCVNPDGRDRYVNWYNSVAGVKPNANPTSREHNEPWPGGRSNHYNFDLNRDWAWQTQIESQQRLEMYNKWMPHVHVDFHEQGFNAPYYFAPAAEPFHEVITPWQRSFQTEIGKNNAAYFDKNGWLYFTREQFDLFYPSYGDTYPTYNGAIGMTYEQGGHSRGGLAVVTKDGDTLTLADRALHHYTTGMSTIEVASRNAEKLVTEFWKYFQNATGNGYGNYKSYVVKNKAADKERVQALKALLIKNDIRFGTAKNGTAQGYNFFSGKDEKLSISEGDLVIPSKQPRSAMVRVLFEPRAFLSDSVTYDITAWALPYAYGLESFATKEEVPVHYSTFTPPIIVQEELSTKDAYAYAIPWTGTNAAKALGILLQQGIKVRYAQEPFRVDGEDFDRGTLIVTRAANKHFSGKMDALMRKLEKENEVEVQWLNTGFAEKGFDFGSDKVRLIKRTNVALVTGDRVSSLGAGEVWHFFEQELGYPLNLVNYDDLGQLNWSETDVLIVPSNYSGIFSEKNSAEKIREWVSNGGRLIAIENSVAQIARTEWGLKPKKEEEKDKEEEKKNPYEALRTYANRERDDVQTNIPGAIYKIDLDNTHPLAFGYPNYYYALKMNAQVYEYFSDNGWNVGVLKKDNYVTGFAGNKLKPYLSDGMVLGVQPMGLGQIVYLTENPLFRSFWENGKLMLCNAVFLVGQ
ncbi:MAG: M14 metallopeptidase family protein [Chitinophagaceae bacterium]